MLLCLLLSIGHLLVLSWWRK